MLLHDDISDKELKQRWRLYWIQSIFEFSNAKFQQMAWIQGAQADWPNGELIDSSFEGCLSAYFDDLALDDAYAKAVEWGNVSKEEADQAKEFHQLVVFYDEPSNNPEDILNDAEWMEVVDSAKAFWDYLKATIKSEREIQLMKKLEKEFS